MTIRELIMMLSALKDQDAIIVTQPTVSDPVVTIHDPCGGTGFIDGISDEGCEGTGLNQVPTKVRIIATGGIVTATPILVNI